MRRASKFTVIALSFLGLRLCLVASTPPQPCSPALENAAAALARSDFELAANQFKEVSTDPKNPPFVRGLALMGLAETALDRKDPAAAVQAWRQLAGDAALPAWQRDNAERRIHETERTQKGQPGRDPAAYRANLPQLPNPGLVFYVSPRGKDTADGTRKGPFATLTRARDEIRSAKKAHGGTLPKGGAKVLLLGGQYQLIEPLSLTAEDSGTADAPIVYEAEPKVGAVLTGGLPVRGWTRIGSAAVREQLSPAVRDQVLEADLKANGITDWGDATALKKRPELFVDGLPQTLARWPNKDFVQTGDILGTNTFKVWGSIAGCKDGRFKFIEDRAKAWVNEPDVRLYGYWFWDWYEEYQKVAAIDAGNSSFILEKPYSNYGYRKGQRYYAVNVFRELDAASEWYLDRRTGKIYWLPGEKVSPSRSDIVLSIDSRPLVTLENVQHVILLGLTIQECRGDGIHLNGGSDCLLADCTLRRLGGDAIVVEGGLRHAIFGCSMDTLGCGGMRVNGGDRKSLTPGKHLVENCTVSDISRLKRTYAPAVHLDGCGNRVAHNLFERIPSSAMRIEGNDHLVELNWVRNVVQESDDQGGIDMFGNPLYRGVVIRWNRWSDIIGGTECGAAGIRLDDMISGIVLQGNLFERCGAVQFGAVQIHGGKENIVDGNVFVDCHAAVSFSRWDQKRWLEGVKPFLAQALESAYTNRYPDLASLESDPNVNFITRNLLLGCSNTFLRNGGLEKCALVLVSEKAAAALVAGHFTDAQARRCLFEPLPLAEFGPYSHPWRAEPARTNQ